MTQTRGTLVRRVLAEHRTWIWPLGLLLAANLAAVVLAIVPMSRSVAATEVRARQATAEAAARELAVFYRDVLPTDVSAARRLLQLRVSQLARTHNVAFTRALATPELIRDSALGRLRGTAELSGSYADVRAFLYALETARDFVVVDSIVLGEGAETSAPLNLTLNISTYYRIAPNGP
jgi:hypothetical protein